MCVCVFATGSIRSVHAHATVRVRYSCGCVRECGWAGVLVGVFVSERGGGDYVCVCEGELGGTSMCVCCVCVCVRA